MVKKRLLAATLSLGIITPIATSFHESKADNNIETTITYDGAYCINGYRWITYIANSGQRRYIATGEVDIAGNRIS
ncbi:SH3 domain-containing protein, partial [Staphylococcus aureus]